MRPPPFILIARDKLGPGHYLIEKDYIPVYV